MVGLATAFLFGPIWRGDVPLPTRSAFGLTWGNSQGTIIESMFRDRIVQSFPYHLFIARALQSGHLPLWNELLFSGTPFFANGQAGILSPLKLPWWWLPPLLSFDIVILLQSVVAGAGMIVLGDALGWKRPAGLLAGITFTLSAPFVMRLTVTTMSAVIAFLPWILWAILQLHRRLKWKWVTLLSVLIAGAVFGGHVQLAAFVIAYAAAWTAIWWRREHTRRRLLLFGAAFVLGLGLTTIQLLPVKEALGQAYRQPDHRSWSVVLNPLRLFRPDLKSAAGLATVVDQNILGNEPRYRGPANYLEGNLYFGPIGLMLVGWSIRARRQRLWKWLAGLSALIGGFYVFPGWWDLVGKIVPWVTVTPVWRTSFFFVFSLALLAGLGVNELLQQRTPRWGWTLLGLALVISLWQWQGILPFEPRSTLYPSNPLLTKAAELTTDGTRLWTPNGILDQFMPYNIPVVMGYDSVYPKSYLELWSANAELRRLNQLHVKDPNPQVLQVTGANVMLISGTVPPGWTEVATSGMWRLATKDNATPPVHTVQHVVPTADPAKIQDIDPTDTALIAGPWPGIDISRKATTTVLRRTSNELRLAIEAAGSTVVVTNLQWYPGWRLFINGQESTTDLVRVNSNFLGAVLYSPGGKFDVSFRYVPRSLVTGIRVSALSFVLLVLVWWFGSRYDKQAGTSATA